MNVVYVHIGESLPECLYDSLYQTLLINKHSCKVYIIINDSQISTFTDTINNFALDTFTDNFFWQNVIQVIPRSIILDRLHEDKYYTKYIEIMNNKHNKLDSFRDGFWISTTARFFYIKTLMQALNIQDLFHIENDIMMYETFSQIYSVTNTREDKIWMVQDAPNRVVPSILYFPSYNSLDVLTQFITESLDKTNAFINDMDILGRFTHKHVFNTIPNDQLLFDGAAIGQYIGGVDTRNIQQTKDIRTLMFDNPTVGFINETSVFKPNTCKFFKKLVKTNEHCIPIKLLLAHKNEVLGHSKVFKIANVHMHNKQLYSMSSIFDIKYTDMITGDRVLSLCDFVILTRDILQFHQNIEHFAKDIIIVNDWKQVNIEKLNAFFKDACKKKHSRQLSLFIYTHIIDDFCPILTQLNTKIDYTLYLHNSDHSFHSKHKSILDLTHIKKVYSQNVDYPVHHKLSILPIGIANKMWPHGDLLAMYDIMKSSYRERKTKSMYVNINPNTYGYRKEILDAVKESTFELATSKPYQEYLRELATFRFCLCIRGNGLDTHRFWESLYLGVIPVIINNSKTNCSNFIEHIKEIQIPFVNITIESTEDIFLKYSEDYFSEALYKSFIQKFGSIWNLDALKLSYYSSF